MAEIREVAVSGSVQTAAGYVEILHSRLQGGDIYTQSRVGSEVVERPLGEVVREVAAAAPGCAPAVLPDRDMELLHYATPAERRVIDEWERHVLDVLHGRPGGGPDSAPYDPLATTEGQRVKAKEEELGLKRGEMRRKMLAYEAKGRRAFLHGNKRLPGDVLRMCDPAVLVVIRGFVEREKVRSKKMLTIQYAMVLAELRQRGLAASGSHQTTPGDEPLPLAERLLPEKQFKAVVRALRHGANPANDAKTSQSQQKRPKHGPVRHRALDFGDLVEIDSTPCDFQVWGPDGPQKVHAVLGSDAATRFPWIHLSLGAPRGLNLALLLHDMINPQPIGALAPESAITTVPHAVRINAWPPHAGDTAPAVLPGCIALDHGTEGENTHFISLLAELGVQIEWARTMTPTDKAHIESLISKFAIVSQLFPGHKGNAVKNRPERLQTLDLPTFRAVAAAFRLWSFYAAAQPHLGLPHGLAAKRFLSPNEALLSSLARGTPLRVLGDPNLAMRFLPSFTRVPGDSGVDWDKVTYWDPDRYEDLIECASAAGKARQRLVFHTHPHDNSRIFWNVPNTHDWRILYAPGGDGLNVRPFDDVREELLKEIPGSKRPTKTETAVAQSYLLEEFQRLFEADAALPPPASPSHPKPIAQAIAFELSTGGWDLDDLEALSISPTDLTADDLSEPW